MLTDLREMGRLAFTILRIQVRQKSTRSLCFTAVMFLVWVSWAFLIGDAMMHLGMIVGVVWFHAFHAGRNWIWSR